MNQFRHLVAPHAFVSARFLRLSVVAGVVALGALPTLRAETVRISVDSNGNQAQATTYGSGAASISADGRWIVFVSEATNLVANDTNGAGDVFLHDLETGMTARISVDSAGGQANGSSSGPRISADGRVVVFGSSASNLVPGDTNGHSDAFVRDLAAGTTSRVNVSSIGQQASDFPNHFSISADGRIVAFDSYAYDLVSHDTNADSDVFVHDRATATTTRVSVDSNGVEADGYSAWSSLSADGRYVAFYSKAQSLTPGSVGNVRDIFVHDRATGITRTVTSSPPSPIDGSRYPSLSADGRWVVFQSDSPTLVPGDTNGLLDVFRCDLSDGSMTLVSVDENGVQANGASFFASISADGRYVAFTSEASNLVPSDSNGAREPFVRDCTAQTIERVSLDSNGAEADDTSDAGFPTLSADLRRLVFSSRATNLVPGDTNGVMDVFVVDRGVPEPLSYCTAKLNSQGCTALIAWTGTPSASLPAPFVISAHDVVNQKSGFLLYGADAATVPFLGGFLCVGQPLHRTPPQSSGGNTTGADCSGSLAYDFNARIQSGVDPALVPGVVVHAQFIYRDPLDATGFSSGLTNALAFTIRP